ncbi:hypothetical protein C7271_18990 [filamentous cyanobacterium CCP5]|nr:hypothetical protein C7271_18990 [filamentous cyanobacterium CCP5]
MAKPFRLFVLLCGALFTLWGGEAIAAETVLLRYRGFGRAVPVEDLEILAETGEAPESIDSILSAAGQSPQNFQRSLTRQLAVRLHLLDRTLNSWPGEWALDQMGEMIHPPSGRSSRQALRASIILSAADDERISVLELLQNYPTQQVVLEVDRIESVYDRLSALLEPFSLLRKAGQSARPTLQEGLGSRKNNYDNN